MYDQNMYNLEVKEKKDGNDTYHVFLLDGEEVEVLLNASPSEVEETTKVYLNHFRDTSGINSVLRDMREAYRSLNFAAHTIKKINNGTYSEYGPFQFNRSCNSELDELVKSVEAIIKAIQ